MKQYDIKTLKETIDHILDDITSTNIYIMLLDGKVLTIDRANDQVTYNTSGTPPSIKIQNATTYQEITIDEISVVTTDLSRVVAFGGSTITLPQPLLTTLTNDPINIVTQVSLTNNPLNIDIEGTITLGNNPLLVQATNEITITNNPLVVSLQLLNDPLHVENTIMNDPVNIHITNDPLNLYHTNVRIPIYSNEPPYDVKYNPYSLKEQLERNVTNASQIYGCRARLYISTESQTYRLQTVRANVQVCATDSIGLYPDSSDPNTLVALGMNSNFSDDSWPGDTYVEAITIHKTSIKDARWEIWYYREGTKPVLFDLKKTLNRNSITIIDTKVNVHLEIMDPDDQRVVFVCDQIIDPFDLLNPMIIMDQTCSCYFKDWTGDNSVVAMEFHWHKRYNFYVKVSKV